MPPVRGKFSHTGIQRCVLRKSFWSPAHIKMADTDRSDAGLALAHHIAKTEPCKDRKQNLPIIETLTENLEMGSNMVSCRHLQSIQTPMPC